MSIWSRLFGCDHRWRVEHISYRNGAILNCQRCAAEAEVVVAPLAMELLIDEVRRHGDLPYVAMFSTVAVRPVYASCGTAMLGDIFQSVDSNADPDARGPGYEHD